MSAWCNCTKLWRLVLVLLAFVRSLGTNTKIFLLLRGNYCQLGGNLRKGHAGNLLIKTPGYLMNTIALINTGVFDTFDQGESVSGVGSPHNSGRMTVAGIEIEN